MLTRRALIIFFSLFRKQNPPATPDQCVFIKGYRAKRILFRIRPIRAAAEPQPDYPNKRREDEIRVTPVTSDPKVEFFYGMS